jgi:insertion element IS1 protein InsB
VVWVLGDWDTATFQRLYDKVKHLEHCIFYTDDWDAFARVLPKDRHVMGKSRTTAVGWDNSNAWHHLGRFTRRSKVVSRCDVMVDTSLKLWQTVLVWLWGLPLDILFTCIISADVPYKDIVY